MDTRNISNMTNFLIHDYLDESPYILRPLNYAPQRPGRGWGVYDTKAGPIAVINLIGRCNMNFGPDNPFLQIAPLLDKIDAKMCVIDFHAEATSEKLAMARLLDGRISALWGTHTHIPTADCRVLSGGTGYQTDLGMTGPSEGVLGIRTEQSIANFRGDLTSRYEGQGIVLWEARALGLELFMSKRLEQYNPALHGYEDIVSPLLEARKKEKQRDDLSAYNTEVMRCFDSLL